MMFLTFALSVVWDIEIGIVVSLIISLLLVIKRSSQTRMMILVCRVIIHTFYRHSNSFFQGRIPGTDKWGPIADNPGAEDVPGILIIRIRESLDFGGPSYIVQK
jgi:MFS superfamily sulfate permease-like transporter